MWITSLNVALTGLLLALGVNAGKPPPQPPPPTAQGSFADHFVSWSGELWAKADGWKYSSPFDCGWRADHLELDSGLLTIKLDEIPTQGSPYASGEYRTTGYYGYGCYEASFKPIAASGVVSSFFTYAGADDNGGNGVHNEIDIEFLGYDTTQMQANFWTNDDAYANSHEAFIDLGFDASLDFHVYGFKWTAAGIEWWVDGSLVYAVASSQADPTPKACESFQKIMMNVWPVDATASGWAGAFVYPGAPLTGEYDWVRHTAGEACSMAEPPPAPPAPPSGDPSVMHVATISMSLHKQNTQANALVTIRDGNGQPVPGVTLTGQWSGLVNSSNTSKITGAAGSAAFYSARSTAPGAFTFCVNGAAKSGMTYDPAANAATCGSITKP